MLKHHARTAAALSAITIASGGIACAPKENEPTGGSKCAPNTLAAVGPTTGTAQVFSPDPMIGSNKSTLSPTSLQLDNYRSAVKLSNLGGNGVLEGTYVDVRDGLNCDGWFGAYDTKNSFSYSHADPRFQEAMSYYWGDRFRGNVGKLGYLPSNKPVVILAHCEMDDNAFFSRQADGTGIVCLGDSVRTKGASYSDDANVSVHELQHQITVDTYSTNMRLNQFLYDEAGALNEAISDFMSLAFLQPELLPESAGWDPKLFSRWALGTFIPGHSGVRGAHRCPAWDPSYPLCGSYPNFAADSNTVSYVYPDGMGWPYAANFKGPGFAHAAYTNYSAQEEIHNAGILIEGAMWDAYEGIKASRGGDQATAQGLASKAVIEAIKHLPKPTSTSLSPVTFREFAANLSAYASLAGLNAADQAALNLALTQRGLLGGTPVPANWAEAGPGNTVTPGVRIIDNPSLLKTWSYNLTGSATVAYSVPQGIETGLNGRLDPGEWAVIWFDIQNVSAVTAGAVQVTARSLDADVSFAIDLRRDVWAEGDQIQYGKVNGTAIVSSLASSNATYHVPTGNSYFKSNPFSDPNYNLASTGGPMFPTTGMWVRVSKSAPHGKVVHIQVEAKPSNGATSTIDFPITIN